MQYVFVHLLVEVIFLKVFHVCDSVFENVLTLDCCEDEVDVVYPEDVSFSLGEFLRESFFGESVDEREH